MSISTAERFIHPQPGQSAPGASDFSIESFKKWTVSKDNRARISVLTSVCVVPFYPNGTMQLDSNLPLGYETQILKSSQITIKYTQDS